VFKRLTTAELWSVAAIVWGIAVLVGVFVGLPLLFGLHIDVGLMINILVAIGTFGAAAAAVWVATGDRRLRRQEIDAAYEAQARLVVVHKAQQRLHPDVETSPLGASFRLQVDNYGGLSILDVKLESASPWMPNENAWIKAAWLQKADVLTIVPPHREVNPDWLGKTQFHWGVLFLGEDHQQVLKQVEGNWPEVNLDRIVATVSFTDAHGERWRRSTDGGLQRVGK
jgi:hypothetical protein